VDSYFTGLRLNPNIDEGLLRILCGVCIYFFFSFDNAGNNLQGVLCLLPVEIFDWFVFTESKSESVKRGGESMVTDVEQRANREVPTFVDTNKTLPISLCLLSPCSVCSVFSHFLQSSR